MCAKNIGINLNAKFFILLMACISIFISQLALAGSPRTPDRLVCEFYKWYVHDTNKDRYPLQDDRAKLSIFISKSLIEEIDHGAGEDADYFTKSQDDFPEWKNNISVNKANVEGNTATVITTIGTTKESYHKLIVTLKKEGQDWKIRKILE